MGKREIIAFVLAPLPVVGPVVIMIGIILAGFPKDWADALGAMLKITVMSYGVTLLIGLPIHLLLYRNKRTALSAYTGLAAITVAILAGTFAALDWFLPASANANPFALHMWSGFGFRITLIAVALASLSAAIFWSVAVRKPRS